MTKAGMAERDSLVLGACRRLAIPVVAVMSGGYARDIHHTVDIHATTVLEAARSWAAAPREESRT